MNELWRFVFSPIGQQVGVLAYLLFILGNTLLNRLTLPRLGTHRPPTDWPEVAVLVPARNEAHNIGRCLRSLLAQDYPRFSVWVLDDHSEDDTTAIVRELAAQDDRLHLLTGRPLPPDWLGKPWACQQLADAAPPEAALLLFVDADTWHAPDMLRAAVSTMLARRLDLLSILPRQITGTWAERLTVPILPWALLSHFPLWLTQRVRWPGLSAAVGQFMLWRRKAYHAVGGHTAVRTQIAEDMALARRAAQEDLRVALLPGPEHVFCHMYHTAGEVLQGFGKNLYAVFGKRWLPYLFVWLWLNVVFLSPWVLWVGSRLGGWPVSPRLTGLAIALSVVVWYLVVLGSGLARRIILLYPLVVLASLLLAFYSLGQHITHRASWKGRQVA